MRRRSSELNPPSESDGPQTVAKESGGIFGFLSRGSVKESQKKETNSSRRSGLGSSPDLAASDVSENNTFSSGMRLPQMPSAVYPSEELSDRERVEINIVKTLISNYYSIVKKNVVDAVPKSVMYFMVNTAKDVIQRECVAQLYKSELFEHLLMEAKDIESRRMRCKENLRCLRNAASILNRVRDYHIT